MLWHTVSINIHQSHTGHIWSLREELTSKDFPLQLADLKPAAAAPCQLWKFFGGGGGKQTDFSFRPPQLTLYEMLHLRLLHLIWTHNDYASISFNVGNIWQTYACAICQNNN